jgi:hypothetical protein
MGLYLTGLAICILTQSFATAEAESDCGSPVDLHDGWSVGSPEQQGFDSALLCTMENGVANGKLANVDSIVIVRHGVLVYERYFTPDRFDRLSQATKKHHGFSMTKSGTSLHVPSSRHCCRSRPHQGFGRLGFLLLSRIRLSPRGGKGSDHPAPSADHVRRIGAGRVLARDARSGPLSAFP